MRVLLCIKTLVSHVMCLKRPITVPLASSEPFHLLRLMGVSVPSLHIESIDSMIVELTGAQCQNFQIDDCREEKLSILIISYLYIIYIPAHSA